MEWPTNQYIIMDSLFKMLKDKKNCQTNEFQDENDVIM